MTSGSTREFMALCAIAQHFGRPGTPTDQAWIESLNGHIKAEYPHLLAITDPATLRAELKIVRAHYDGVSLHAGIGYVTPNDEHQGRGEAIRKARQAGLVQARLSRLAWHRQHPELHRRAILATLLGRNLHADGDDRDDSFLEGVQLSGVKLVPSAIEEDHSISEGSGEGIRLPVFDGEHGGSAAPKRGPLDEAIDKINEMFKAKGVDVSPESVSGFITTFWGFLDDNEEAVPSLSTWVEAPAP